MIEQFEQGFLRAALVSIPFVLVLALAAGRILGVRQRRGPALVAAMTGWAVAVTVSIEVTQSDDRDLFLPLALVLGIAATMFVAVALALVLGPGRGRKGGGWSRLLHPLRRTAYRLSLLRRAREVIGIARSHQLTLLKVTSSGAVSNPEFGVRLRDTLQDCGGVFVKFGQVASTRTDLLPATVTTPLADLQADVKPADPDEVRAELEGAFADPIDEVFASFDWNPLAAASIGQTYRAVLRDGTDVVVKVRRPGIEELVHRDGEALVSFASFVDGRVGSHLSTLAGELVKSVNDELDYLHEATNGALLARNRDGDQGIAIPRVHRELCSPAVLVMDFAPGRSIATLGVVEAAARPREEIARNVLTSFLGQILQDGLYHADPHPGNVLIDDIGDITLIDFGSVGVLDPRLLGGLQLLALGVTQRDPEILVRGLVHIGSARSTTDRIALETDVSRLLAEQTRGGFSAESIRQVLAVMTRHGMHVPEAFVVLSRAMLTLEGTLKLIDPDLEFGDEAQRIVSGWFGPEQGDSEEILKREAARNALLLRDLPLKIDDIASALVAGELAVNVSRFGGDDREVVGAWFNRAVIAAVGIGALLTGALLLVGAAIAPGNSELHTALVSLGVFTLFSGWVLTMRAVARALSPVLR